MKRIDVLPDDVLLEIFDFYVDGQSYGGKSGIEAWQSLVHVCRRWRNLVFRSPRRLNLQLYCSPETPAKDTLGIWPALPLLVWGEMASSGVDNVIAALEQSNRVCQIYLWGLTGQQLEEILAVMQVPFPELTDLELDSNETLPVIPDSFLGGSAPRLRNFTSFGIPFPGLPKLLSSAADHLVELWIRNIPHSGYISPEAMAALLSTLSSLEKLSLEFQSLQSRPDLESPSLPPPNRSILPALDWFEFKGATEYLENLVTRIDTPQFVNIQITFFNQIDFDCPRLAQFISRTPTLRARDNAHVKFDDSETSVALPAGVSTLVMSISSREPDWQLSSVAQLCNSSLPRPSTVEDLYIEYQYSRLVWKDDAIENVLWLELLLPFTAVKNLYLSKQFAPGIATALKELVGITEVLPSLQNIFVEGFEPSGPFQKNIGDFVAARQLSDHPIAISVWDKNSNM